MKRAEWITEVLGDSEERKRLVFLILGASIIRLISDWMLGEGAPFGPDGTGAEAAVHLGGHIYPLHILLISLFGSAKTVSIVLGTLSVPLLWSYSRATGLGEGGAWLMATLPMAVYPSVLSAGDAPALFFVLLGATIAVHSPQKGVASSWQLLGSLIAMSSVAVKPIALPALVLLLPRPRAALGALLLAPLFHGYLDPLLDPKEGSGLLGSWWRGSNGQPPEDWLSWLAEGSRSLADQPLWTCSWLVLLAGLGSILGETREARWDPWTRWGGLAALAAALAIACLFGEKLQARYLAPAMVACLPWVGAWAPSWSSPLLAWPTLALMTQLSAYRAAQDPHSEPPDVPQIRPPVVDVEALFENASTADATAMMEDAHRLGRDMKPGDSFTIERRLHGREGELLWPLQVANDDLVIESDPLRPHTHLRVRIPE